MVFFVLKILRLLIRLALLPFRLAVRLVRAALGRASDDDETDELEDWPTHDGSDAGAGGETGEVAETEGGAATESETATEAETATELESGPTDRVTGGASTPDSDGGASAPAAALEATTRERRLAQVFVVGLVGYAVCAVLSPFVAGSRMFPAVLGTVAYGGTAFGTARGSTAARWLGTGLLLVGALVVHVPFEILSAVYDLGGPTLLDFVFFTAPATLGLVSPAATVLGIGLAVVGYLGRGGTGAVTSLPGLGGHGYAGGESASTSPTSAPNSAAAATAGATGTSADSGSGDEPDRSGSRRPDTAAGSESAEPAGTSTTAAGGGVTTAAGAGASTSGGESTADESTTGEQTTAESATAGASTAESTAGATGARTASGAGHRLDSDATVLAADGGSVVLAGDAVACHEPSGEERWTFELRDEPTAVAVGGGSVYVGTGTGRVHSLAVETGAEEWPLPFRAGTAVTDLGVGSHCYVAADDGRIRALDPEQGTTEWRSAVGGDALRLAVTDDGPVASGEALVALDSAGEERWRHEVSGAGSTPVAATDSRIVCGAGRTVTALDGEATVQWDTTDDARVTALAAADGAVVVARESSVETLDATDGERTGSMDCEAVAVAAPPTVIATEGSVRFSRQ